MSLKSTDNFVEAHVFYPAIRRSKGVEVSIQTAGEG